MDPNTETGLRDALRLVEASSTPVTEYFCKKFPAEGRSAAELLVAWRGFLISLLKPWRSFSKKHLSDDQREQARGKVRGFQQELDYLAEILVKLGVDVKSIEGRQLLKQQFPDGKSLRREIEGWFKSSPYCKSATPPKDYFGGNRLKRSEERDMELFKELCVLLEEAGACERGAAKAIARSVSNPKKRWGNATPKEMLSRTAFSKADHMVRQGFSDKEILHQTRYHRKAGGVSDERFNAALRKFRRQEEKKYTKPSKGQSGPPADVRARKARQAKVDRELRDQMRGPSSGGGKKRGKK